MTGFGRGEGICGGMTFRIEVRSVNHRYCDINLRIPDRLTRLERGIRTAISTKFSRGKFDVSISQVDIPLMGAKPVLNLSPLLQCQTILREMSKALNVDFNIRNDIGLSDLQALKDMVTLTQIDYENPEIDRSIAKVLDKSLSDLMKMRQKEGRIIYKDLKLRIRMLESMLKKIDRHVPVAVREMRKRYLERIKGLSDTSIPDVERLHQEIAIMVERMDITEEIVRVGSHISQFLDKLEEGVPVGRTLDFILQEINREINTIASKASNIIISRIVIDMKAEVERMREQVQNIE